MCSRPRPTGSSWQFVSSLGFGVTLGLLWAWPRHVEAGRWSARPHRCTERCHIVLVLLALHLSYKPMSPLWELNQGLCEIPPTQRHQKGWAFIRGQYKATWAALHRKGRENSIPLSSFIFLLSPLPMRNASGPPGMYLGLLKNAPRFCSLTWGFFGFCSELPYGGIWQYPITLWGSQGDLCFYLSIKVTWEVISLSSIS